MSYFSGKGKKTKTNRRNIIRIIIGKKEGALWLRHKKRALGFSSTLSSKHPKGQLSYMMRNNNTRQPPVGRAKSTVITLALSSSSNWAAAAKAYVVVVFASVFVRSVSGAPAVFFTSANEGDRIRFDAALENKEHYFGRLSEENVLEKLRLFNDAEKEADEVDATILLDQPRWTLADERLMAKLLFSSRENVEEETKKKTMLFAPRFSRSHERREEEKTKHTVKEIIEKRASEDSSLRGRVRYWNCDTSDNGDKNVDQQVKAILGVLTGSSKDDKEPTDRVGIVICGGEKKEEDFSLFQALMKALMKMLSIMFVVWGMHDRFVRHATKKLVWY